MQPVPQDHSRATYAPMLKKEDGAVDWTRPAASICNQVRAMVPWPRTYAFIKGMRVVIHQAHAAGDDGHRETPGEIIRADAESIIAACGEGILHITELQREGKKRISASDFLKGFPLAPGDVFER